MLVKKYIDDLGIVIKENVTFDINDESKYIHEFKFLQSRGIINNADNFYDIKWNIRERGTMKVLKFPFNEVWFEKMKKKNNLPFTYKAFNMAIRIFIVESMKTYVFRTYYSVMRVLYKNLNLTNFFALDKFDDMEKYYDKLKTFHSTTHGLGLEFFSFFYEYDIAYEYRELIYDLIRSKGIRNVRTLPHFEDIFDFNDIINDFVHTASEKELKRFYPIVLWWKITNIIPLRTTEFLVTKKDCINGINGKFYLDIRRSILKGRGIVQLQKKELKDVYKDETIEITEEIYNLIDSYLNCVRNEVCDEDRECLFSYHFHYKYRIGKRFINADISQFTYKNLYSLLELFFEKIVEKKYNRDVISRYEEVDLLGSSSNKKLVKMQLYDTRHLAIINLIFSGCEAETTKALAGHTMMSTTAGYYDHYEEYVRSYAIAYAKRLKSEKDKDTELFMDTIKSNADEQEKRLIVWDGVINGNRKSNIRYKKVDGGYCTHTLKSYEQCLKMEGVHKACPYFEPDNDEMIIEEIKNVNHQIRAELDTLRELLESEKMISNVSEKRAVVLEKIRRLSNSKAETMSKLSNVELIEANEGQV